jgi:hypothetical protein
LFQYAVTAVTGAGGLDVKPYHHKALGKIASDELPNYFDAINLAIVGEISDVIFDRARGVSPLSSRG